MGKKLENNGLWESSRMIIPQHKEASINQALEWKRRERPTLDDQQIDRIALEIAKSLSWRRDVQLSVYGPFETYNIPGIVTRVDRQLKRFRIDFDGDYVWIDFSDVLSAELKDDGFDAP